MTRPLVTASTYKFVLDPTKDGEPWDLTGATVTLILYSPSGVESTHSATVVGGGATAYYITDTNDIDAAGVWQATWRVQQGDIDGRFYPLKFRVVEGFS